MAAIAAIAVGPVVFVAATFAPRFAAAKPGTQNGPSTETAATAFPEVGVADVRYEPGHDSGWHAHPGVHSVVVLSGILTIYDERCERQDYGVGQTYIGGIQPHVARNETPEPVELVVTYVYTSRLDHGQVVAPPAGCDVG